MMRIANDVFVKIEVKKNQENKRTSLA